MTIVNQYITTFLSSYKLYNLMDDGFKIEVFKPYIFVETRNSSINKVVPDYVFKEIEENLFAKDYLDKLILDFLDELIKMLYTKNNNIYVYENSFEEWQNIITKISPLIIISYFIFKQKDNRLVNNFRNSSLPSIYNKRLEYLIQNNEINDLHIHLNGTTEFDIVWQDLLQDSSLILGDYEKGFKDSFVKEVYYEFGIYNIALFINEIKASVKYRKNYEHNFTLPCEMQFFINSFEMLNDNDNSAIKDINNFYKYVLMYNTNYKLLVQQTNQIGFDTFQKITNIEIREYTEKEYQKRFNQIKTIYNHNSIKLEGRFAPKKDISKFVNLLDSISSVNTDNLSLTTHFIKKKDSNLNSTVVCRDSELRDELNIITDNLLLLLSKNKYKNMIDGFDAAANELHARPEVFAPIFKKLKNNGYDYFTFHGGEDFIDLVSGIRYVYEIVQFLKFDNGNRIGHATALGIDPKLWQGRVGKKLYISQGEYLDNLIFIYYISKKNKKLNKIALKVEDNIYKYCRKIYGTIYHISELVDAWLLRDNDPKLFFAQNENLESNHIKLYKLYHTDKNVVSKYNEKITFNTNLLTSKELIRVQNEILKVLNKKNIVIESMITSNKIISFYKKYKEHHISRWLMKSPKPIVVIATDDPGIFATNMKNELVHLYLILKNKLDNEEEVFDIIEKLIKNSEIYAFTRGDN